MADASASPFGWHCRASDKAADLGGGLEAAFEGSEPDLVVTPVDYRQNMLLTERPGEIVGAGAGVA